MAGTPNTCSNCSEPHGPDDVFCESCGFDFLSGSLPDAQQGPSALGAAHAAEAAGLDPNVATTSAPSAQVAADVAAAAVGNTPASTSAASNTTAGRAAVAHATVTVDASLEFFERLAAGGPVTFPDPAPEPFTVELVSDNVLIGRHSDSRGVYPEVDLTDNDDVAASTRHAMLKRAQDGTWTITDVGSTNGTFLDDAVIPLAEGAETPLVDGTVIYVGAWTRIILTPVDPA